MSLPRLSHRNHPLAELFYIVDEFLLRFEKTQGKRGRPAKFSNAQIVKCMVYQVFYLIRSYRELEWKLQKDHWAKRAMGLMEVPNYTTLCRRAKSLETNVCYELLQDLLHELKPKNHVCYEHLD
jgi:hypothetical protein